MPPLRNLQEPTPCECSLSRVRQLEDSLFRGLTSSLFSSFVAQSRPRCPSRSSGLVLQHRLRRQSELQSLITIDPGLQSHKFKTDFENLFTTCRLPLSIRVSPPFFLGGPCAKRKSRFSKPFHKRFPLGSRCGMGGPSSFACVAPALEQVLCHRVGNLRLSRSKRA